MTIRKIIGENGAMPQLCNGGQCPAIILAEDGNAYVQGLQLAANESSALVAPPGEGFVKMPLATLRKLAAQTAAL
jgi:hypothetical protein